jgi:hypothetical protein
MFNKPHTKTAKEKLSKKMKGKHNSPATEFKKGHIISQKTKEKVRERLLARNWKGINHPNWKGNNVCYRTLHYWLENNFGKAIKCENKSCNGKNKHYEWALKKGKPYEKKRDYFWQLCRSCHRKEDYKGNWKNKYSQSKVKKLSIIKTK